MAAQNNLELRQGWNLLTEKGSNRKGVVSSLWQKHAFCNIVLGVEHPHQLEQVRVEFKNFYDDKLEEFIDVEGLKIKYFHSANGELTVTISRNLHSSLSIFETITNDILEAISKLCHEPGREIFYGVDKRIRIWLNFLKQKSPKQLSTREQIGLFGELLLFKSLKERFANEAVWMNGWKGPEKNNKDFVYESFELEVKSILSDEGQIKISSLQQLEMNQKCPLYLAILKLDEVSEGETLPTLVDRCLELFESEFCRDIFISKLTLVGYSHFDKNLYTKKFSIRNDTILQVDEFFPRLTAAVVDKQIVSASYVISTAGLERFVVTGEKIYGDL